MGDTGKPDSGNELLARIVVVLVVAFIWLGGWGALRKYLRREVSHEKLTTLRYHGDWSIGEYRECNSINLREEDSQPELDCIGSSPIDREKVFKISFSGDVTYDDEKPNDALHYWMCRRNDAEPSFSCGAKKIPPSEPQASENSRSRAS